MRHRFPKRNPVCRDRLGKRVGDRRSLLPLDLVRLVPDAVQEQVPLAITNEVLLAVPTGYPCAGDRFGSCRLQHSPELRSTIGPVRSPVREGPQAGSRQLRVYV